MFGFVNEKNVVQTHLNRSHDGSVAIGESENSGLLENRLLIFASVDSFRSFSERFGAAFVPAAIRKLFDLLCSTICIA